MVECSVDSERGGCIDNDDSKCTKCVVTFYQLVTIYQVNTSEQALFQKGRTIQMIKQESIMNENVYTVDSFQIMYRRYQTIVEQQIRKLGIFKDKEDYFQEGMYAILEALPTLSPYHPNKVAYLTQHVRRRLIDTLRKTNRQTAPIIYSDDQTLYEEHVTQTYECELLDYFDPEDLTIVHLILKGYKHKEIATKLGIHPRTVQRRLQKYQDRFPKEW